MDVNTQISATHTYPASLAILTWKAPKTLNQTLASLKPIKQLFAELIVVCQEADSREEQVAKKHGFEPILLKENIGIQHGLKRAVQSCSHEHVLLLENDCFLTGGLSNSIKTLISMNRLLGTEKIDFGSLQVLPNYPSKKFFSYWKIQNSNLQPTLIGRLRQQNANAILSDAIGLSPPVNFPLTAVRSFDDSLFLTNSRYRKWSNRAVYVSKSFFLEKIIAFAEQNPTSRHCNGLPELEHRINSRAKRHWWRSQKFKIAVAHPGLFDHQRFDRSADDDKRINGGPIREL